MKPTQFFAATALGTALLVLAQAAARAQFEELTSRVPQSANTIVLINVDKLLDSPMAVAERWRDDPVQRFAAGLTNVPSDAKQVVLAAQLDLEFMRPLWELGMIRVDQAPTLADLAETYNGTPDSVADLPAVQLPDDSYLVRFSDTLLGAHAPGNRQAVSRWLRQPHGGLSPYLREAIGYAAAGTEFIVAVDLQDAAAIDDARKQLESLDNPVLKAAGIDVRELAELLASVKGLMLGVTFDQRAFGKIKLDFGRDASMLAGIAKPLFLAILEERGLMIDEFHDWKAQVEGDRIMFGGYLTSSGLMRLSSLVDLPTYALHTPPRRTPVQIEAPAEDQPTATTPSPPEQPAEPRVPVPAPAPPVPVPPVSVPAAVPSPGDLQPIVVPTRQYFQQVGHLLSDLRSRKRGAQTYGQVGVWYESYARKVDRLPLVKVDSHMLDYGRYVGNQLRNASAAIRAGSVQSRVGQVDVVYQGVQNPRYGPPVRRPMTLREEALARTRVRTHARTASAASAQQIEFEIDAATAEVRQLMAKKYNVSM